MSAKRIIALLAIAALGLGLVGAPRAAQGAAVATLTIEPANLTLATDDTAWINLRINNITDLYGASVRLTFDPSVIEIVDAEPGGTVQIQPGDMPTPDIVLRNLVDNGTGTVWYEVRQWYSIPSMGSGTLASVQVRGRAAGTSTLRFVATSFYNTEGWDIPISADTGTIQVIYVPTRTPTVTPTPTATPIPTVPPPTATPTPTPASWSWVPLAQKPLPTPTPTVTPTATPAIINGIEISRVRWWRSDADGTYAAFCNARNGTGQRVRIVGVMAHLLDATGQVIASASPDSGYCLTRSVPLHVLTPGMDTPILIGDLQLLSPPSSIQWEVLWERAEEEVIDLSGFVEHCSCDTGFTYCTYGNALVSNRSSRTALMPRAIVYGPCGDQWSSPWDGTGLRILSGLGEQMPANGAWRRSNSCPCVFQDICYHCAEIRGMAWVDCAQSSRVWTNFPMLHQSGLFTATFEAMPSVAPMDGLIGLSANPTTALSGLGPIVRYNAEGLIDARDGAAYRYDQRVTYSARSHYYFQLIIDVVNHRYTVDVAGDDYRWQRIATNYAFRSEQSSVTYLDNWATWSYWGTVRICGFHVGAGR